MIKADEMEPEASKLRSIVKLRKPFRFKWEPGGNRFNCSEDHSELNYAVLPNVGIPYAIEETNIVDRCPDVSRCSFRVGDNGYRNTTHN
jgi:hypothetical protein